MKDFLSLDELGNIDVLVAEDDKDLRRLIQFDLEGSNFKVRVAENGQIALDKIREKKPDCIILDVMMPVMDGFEVCKRLKSMNATRDIPIIFLTARGSTEDKVKGMGFNADDYMVKPFDFAELAARIKLHVSKRNVNKDDLKKAGEKALKESVNDLAKKLKDPLDRLRKELVAISGLSGQGDGFSSSLARCEQARREIRDIFVELQTELDPFFEPEEEKETVTL